MRRTAYILTLIGIWAASLAALALGLDGLEHPPFVPIALISGAYFGAVSTVSLAEEIAGALGRISGNRTGRPLISSKDHPGGDLRSLILPLLGS
jgi:hypothetical protein